MPNDQEAPIRDARQAEIAELVADGKSNREIAALRCS